MKILIQKGKRSGLLLVALLFSFSNGGWAAFKIEGQTPLTAKARTTGTAVVAMNAIIKPHINGNDPQNYTEILWSNTNMDNPLTNPWKIADHFVILETTITSVSGGVMVFTDNTNAAANPKFSDPTPPLGPAPSPSDIDYIRKMQEYVARKNNPDSNPAGLVLNKTGFEKFTVPLAWTIKDTKKVVNDPNSTSPTGLNATDPSKGITTGNGNRFQWISMVDYATPAIDWNLDRTLDSQDRDQNGLPDDTPEFKHDDPFLNDTATVIEAARGKQLSQGGGFDGAGAGKRTSYVYFEANFENAFAPTRPDEELEYKTNRLMFEAFSE